MADQAQYMPSTVAMLPPAFAYPIQATPAASRAAACSLDDAIADLSTMKVSHFNLLFPLCCLTRLPPPAPVESGPQVAMCICSYDGMSC